MILTIGHTLPLNNNMKKSIELAMIGNMNSRKELSNILQFRLNDLWQLIILAFFILKEM